MTGMLRVNRNNFLFLLLLNFFNNFSFFFSFKTLFPPSLNNNNLMKDVFFSLFRVIIFLFLLLTLFWLALILELRLLTLELFNELILTFLFLLFGHFHQFLCDFLCDGLINLNILTIKKDILLVKLFNNGILSLFF